MATRDALRSVPRLFAAGNNSTLAPRRSDRERVHTAFHRNCQALSGLSSLACVSKPASSAHEISLTFLSEMCKAVFRSGFLSGQGIDRRQSLSGLSRAITLYGRKSARKNRRGSVSRQTQCFIRRTRRRIKRSKLFFACGQKTLRGSFRQSQLLKNFSEGILCQNHVQRYCL